VIFAYFNLATGVSFYEGAGAILAPSCVRIWSGAYWGLLTSAFVHFAFWHILFNMWWAREFGRVLEPTMGRGWYGLFILGAAVASSGAELAFSSTTGVGFSGVLYAMFGYGLVARRVEPRYERLITRQTIAWLLGWLVLCMVLTVANVWQIANAAHLGGFLYGCLVAAAFKARAYVAASVAGLIVICIVVVLSSVYMPWSPYWAGRQIAAKYLDAPAKARAGDAEAQLMYAQLIMQQKGQSSEAVSWLRKSAEQRYLPGMNNLAWTLATSTNDSVRDGVEAVTWAEKLSKEDGGKSAEYLDTLAAAYAEEGRWDVAVATQQKAVAALAPPDASFSNSVVSHLQKYLKQEKVRE